MTVSIGWPRITMINYCFKAAGAAASGLTCTNGSGLIENCPVKGRS